jgi:multidrug resistance efflux pump
MNAELRRRFELWRARRALDRADAALVHAVREIDRHAIASHQASALYRAHEARLIRLDQPWHFSPESGR